MPLQFEITTTSPQQTMEFGAKLAKQLSKSSVVTFNGNLGSGKTTLIRGLSRELNVQEHVTSPTFTLINEYNGDLPIYHFDFYRLNSDIELHDLGVDEYFDGDGICLIEWPEIVAEWLPENRIDIYLAATYDAKSQDKRTIKVHFDNKINELKL